MHAFPFTIADERPDHAEAIARLNAAAFGPGRFARTAYRLREEAPPVSALCLTGWRGESLTGSIRFTALRIGEAEGALLLGPLAIAPDAVGQGLGRALIAEGVARAAALDYRLVILVGDIPYYGRVGFTQTRVGQIILPGPADPARILARELVDGSLKEFAGRVVAVAPK